MSGSIFDGPWDLGGFGAGGDGGGSLGGAFDSPTPPAGWAYGDDMAMPIPNRSDFSFMDRAEAWLGDAFSKDNMAKLKTAVADLNKALPKDGQGQGGGQAQRPPVGSAPSVRGSATDYQAMLDQWRKHAAALRQFGMQAGRFSPLGPAGLPPGGSPPGLLGESGLSSQLARLGL